MTPKDVLKELFDLLEDYAPAWYTEEHRVRAANALKESDDVNWQRDKGNAEITTTAESTSKRELNKKTSRPVLATITSRKPVKPPRGPTAQ